MSKHTPEAVEQEFFDALVGADIASLVGILADDFLLIDVMTGSEIEKPALLEVVGGGLLKFEKIDRRHYRVRRYAATAIITGRTEMMGRFDEQPFEARSRYTHVFVDAGERWRMVTAQGTPIADPSPVD